MMSGKTADISQFCELGWYQWVKFCPTTISPKDPLVLGKYLGPSIDVGPAMTAKMMIPTGKAVHQSTDRPPTPEEIADPVEQDRMKALFLQTA